MNRHITYAWEVLKWSTPLFAISLFLSPILVLWAAVLYVGFSSPKVEIRHSGKTYRLDEHTIVVGDKVYREVDK
jgi:hypothetical protein